MHWVFVGPVLDQSPCVARVGTPQGTPHPSELSLPPQGVPGCMRVHKCGVGFPLWVNGPEILQYGCESPERRGEFFRCFSGSRFRYEDLFSGVLKIQDSSGIYTCILDKFSEEYL